MFLPVYNAVYNAFEKKKRKKQYLVESYNIMKWNDSYKNTHKLQGDDFITCHVHIV